MITKLGLNRFMKIPILLINHPIRTIKISVQNFYPIPIKLAALSPTMSEGIIVAWHKKEGESITAGDMICEIQTDKAVVAMDSDEDGTMAKILYPAGTENIPVGSLIALMATTSEDWREISTNAKVPEKVSASSMSSKSKTTETESPATVQNSASQRSTNIIGPAARILIDQHGLNLNQISSTGPHNIIMKSDVLSYLKSSPISKPVASTFSSDSRSSIHIPLTNMRKTIAKRLSESKASIPHLYTRATFSIDNLILMRNMLKNAGFKVSLNDFVVKACGLALLAVPEINSTAKLSQNEQFIFEVQSNVDISIAVATPSGLITPIVQNVDKLSLTDINSKILELSSKAKNNKLQPNEFIGGGFTISNLGMYGIREFTAIINSPQVAILAVGGGMKVVNVDSSLKPETQMTITLSVDARFIDEVASSNFLRHIANSLSQRQRILIQDDFKTQAEIPLDFGQSSNLEIETDQFNVEQLRGII